MNELFKYDDYRNALSSLMNNYEGPQKGLQTRIAAHVGCQQAYLSRVMSGLADLNQEQSLAITEFFNLDVLEKEYFFLIVNFNRAATTQLKNYYKEKILKVQAKKTEISSRIVHKNFLSEESKSIYYSDWIYCAVHILTAIPQYQTIEAISVRLNISATRIKETLNILESFKLVIKKQNKYSHQSGNIHLANDSTYIRSHHTNWRLKSIDSLTKKNTSNLNYSSVIAFSSSDIPAVKEILLDAIKKIRSVIKDSKDEQLYCYNLDFFEI